MKNPFNIWHKTFWALLSLSFLLIICAGFFYIYAQSQLPDVESLKTVKLQVPLQIYSKEGLLIQEYGEKKRIPVTYEEIPPALIHALLATEDQRFFEHPGVDVFGLARATVRMIKTGTKSQGGSTITMQVARNFFLNRKKTFLRKFNEIMLAIKIDRELSKEKILELYLNKIYLGNRAYGVGAAAQVYYGKSLKELSLAELAMMAGLPQAPSTQNPIANPKAAKKRRDHVLARLLEEQYITESAYQEAIAEPITAHFHGTDLQAKAPYVAEMIRQSLYEHFGPSAYTKGYKVYTTLDASLQNKADALIESHLLAYDQRHGYRGATAHLGSTLATDKREQQLKALLPYPVVNDLKPALILAVNSNDIEALLQSGQTLTVPWSGLSWARPALKKGWVGKSPTHAASIVSPGDVVYVQEKEDNTYRLSQIPEAQAALVSLNPSSGAILALVGGFNFQHSKFNRVIQSARQPGSNFKPFLYAAALNKGYSLATLINDAPIVVDDPTQPNMWRPHNDNHEFNGPTRLKDALVRSRNLVSIRILDDIGIQYAIDFATRFGFKKEALPRTLSLALGTLSVSPMDLATAYAVFANGGYKVEPYLIDHITDSDGKILLQAKPSFAPTSQDTLQDPDLTAPRVIPQDVAFLMNSALMDVIQQGTAQEARRLNRKDIAGKTGTTNEQVDAWFSGYSPDIVTTTWVGFDTPSPLYEYAAKLALPLWIDFMQFALNGKPEKSMMTPPNVITAKINPKTGLVDKNNQIGSITEFFRDNEVPEEDAFPEEINTAGNPGSQESLF
ncbi:MAG: penicillin-binding protein 1A [Legionellaceae bacterium]